MEGLLGGGGQGRGRAAARFIDEIAEDGMVWEVKSGQGRLDAREMRQFADYQKMVEYGAKVKPKGSDKAIEVKRIHYVFTNPQGAKKNLVDMWKHIKRGEVRFTLIRRGEPLTLDAEWLGELGLHSKADLQKVLRWLDAEEGATLPAGRWFHMAQNRPRQPARTQLAVQHAEPGGAAGPNASAHHTQEA